MTVNFKKNIYLSLGILIALTARAYGNPLTYCHSDECRAKNYTLSFDAELLYWRPELCGLENVFGNTSVATEVESGITTRTITESHKKPNYQWSPGFRVGGDIGFNCLDLELDWTHFNGHAKFHDEPQHGHWKINYDVIDLTLGHSFAALPCFYVRPFIGVRGAIIHQKLKSNLEAIFISSIGETRVFTNKDNKEDFWGIGPQIGIDANWYLGSNFSLYGNFEIMTYYGDVKGKNFNTDTFPQTVNARNIRKKHCFNNIATDAALGLRWDKSLNCGKCDIQFMLKLGVEQHRIYNFSDLESQGNLSLDGGVFAAGISFSY